MTSKLFNRPVLEILLLFVACTNAQAQHARKLPIYLQTQYSKTLYDRTLRNNPSAIGFGLESFYQNKSKLKPTASISFNLRLAGDKALRFGADSMPIDAVETAFNIRIGESYFFSKRNYMAFAAGPSFINGKMLFGLKTSLGYFFSANQKWVVALSYGNIFDRYIPTKNDYGTIDLSFGLKIY